MAILDRIRAGWHALTETRSRSTYHDYVYARTPGTSIEDAAGEWADEYESLKLAAVWRAVGLISDSVAKVPWQVKDRRLNPDGMVVKVPAYNHPAFRLLSHRPNPEMTAFDFRASMIATCLLWGNALAEIERDRMGRPVALWPIHWSRVQVERERDTTGAPQLVYYVNPTGEPTHDYPRPGEVPSRLPQTDKLPDRDVLHIRWRMLHGVVGVSVIGYARETIGGALASYRYGHRVFANDATPRTVLKHPRSFQSPEAAAAFRQQWQAAHSGRNAGKTAVLEEGMELQTYGMPPKDAQFLESKQFSVRDIARWFGLPPHKLGEDGGAPSASIEQQTLEFREDTIEPWAARLEQEVDHKLLGDDGRAFPRYVSELDREAFTVTPYFERIQAYRVAHAGGMMSVDEIRQREGLNPLPDGAGSIYILPTGVQTVQQMLAGGLGAWNVQQGNVPAKVDNTGADPLHTGTVDRVPGDAIPALDGNVPGVGDDAIPDIRDAHAGLFTDCARRVITRHAKRVSDKAKRLSGADLRAWAQLDLTNQRAANALAIAPVVEAYLRAECFARGVAVPDHAEANATARIIEHLAAVAEVADDFGTDDDVSSFAHAMGVICLDHLEP